LDQNRGLGSGRRKGEIGEGGDANPVHAFQLRARVYTREYP
jgi:hypothetical protein